MSEGLTGAAETSPAPVSYGFYQDAYGGRFRALRCVGGLTGRREPDPGWDEGDADAWRRAVCAAADAFAEYGEGCVGGFSIGSFSVTNYRDDGTTGAEVARGAALAELAGTGLCFAGVRR